METIADAEKGLRLKLYRGYLDAEGRAAWWDVLMRHVPWHRVMYKSSRFGKQCETPCWTCFYGGFDTFAPYVPVPAWLQPLVEQVSGELGVPFNAILLRLYLNGADEIAWHTDGRTFLGDEPTIGSLSLGATARFQMRRMRNVWPVLGGGDDGVDHTTPPREFALGDGDLIVMHGPTQKHWHHRVPKASSRRPRININFRYILPGTPDAERGQATYYKYMVHGDAAPDAAGLAFDEILRRSGSLLTFAASQPPAAEPVAPAQLAREGDAPAPPARPSSSSSSPGAGADGAEWACPGCTLLNPPFAPLCRLCEARNPEHVEAGQRTMSTITEEVDASLQQIKRARTAPQATLTSLWR